MRGFRVRMMAVFAGLCLSLCGCGLFPDEPEIDDTVHIEHYTPVSHSTVKVQRGDLDDSSVVVAYYEYVQQKDYYLQYAGEPNMWGMEIHNYVVVGDMVKKGQLLAEAPCEELEKQLGEYQSQLKEYQSTLSYNKKLLKQTDVSEKASVEDALEDIKAQIEVVNARIAEMQSKIADYRIYADMDGQVTYLADAFVLGEFSSSNRYISVASLDGVFRAEMEETNKVIQEGNTYTALVNEQEVPVTVESVGTGEEGNTEVAFTTEGHYASQTKAEVQIVGEKRNNVLYLPKEAVMVAAENAYVMVIGEDGFPRAKKVEVSGPVSNHFIIESGLKEGDEVVNE